MELPTEIELLRRARRDAWQEGHDLACDLVTPGTSCGYHPNPYDAES